ncbi:MAG: GNAT family N-acetyltransferase [Cyclobacteriaceae bacterium]
MPGFNLKFHTHRIILRPMRESDAAEFAKITGDPDLWKYFTHDLSEHDGLKEWVDEGLTLSKQQKRMAFTVIDRKTNSIAGSTSLGNISERDRRIEIGWTWFGRIFHGRGINDHSKFLLLNHCFENMEFVRVEFKTDVLNEPARVALKRIGAKEDGILRSHTLMTNGRRRDTIYYSILDSEWMTTISFEQ